MKAKRIVPGRNFKAALRDLKALFCLQQTLTEAIHKAKTGEEALQASLDLVCDHTGWPVGRARRVRGDSVDGVGLPDVWHLEDSLRYEPLVRTTQATQKPAVTDLFRRALKSGVPVWVKYLARDCDCERTHTALELGLFSGGAFPVYFGDEVVAVLEFYASSSCQPDRELLDLLRCIGLQLGPVVGHVTADQGHLLGALLDNIPDNVYFKDRESRFIRIGRFLAERFGLSDPSEAVGKTDFEFFNDDHARPAFEDEQQILRTGEPIINKEERETHPDGRVRWVSTTKEPLRDREGNIIGTFGISRDITEQKQVEEALRDSEGRIREVAESNEEMFRHMSEIIGQVFWLADPGVTRLIYVSPAYEKIWGRKRESLYQSPQSWWDAIHPEDRERVISSLPREMTVVWSAEYRIVRTDESVRWISERRFPVRDPSGAIYRVAAVAEDITERKLAQMAEWESEQKYRRLIELSPDSLFVEVGGRIVLINSAGIRLFGAERPEQIVGKRVLDIVHPDHREAVQARMQQLAAGQPVPPLEEKYLRLDGAAVDVEVAAAPLTYLDQPAVQVIVRDISARKSSEEALSRDRSLLRTLIETIPDRIYVKDTEARFILNNIAHLCALGAKSQEETVAKTDFDFRPADLAAKCMADDQQVLQSGRPLNNREEQTILENGEPGWLLVSKMPLRDSRGRVIGLVGISRDITERKRAEEELGRERNLLRTLIETLPDRIYVKDTGARFILNNIAHIRGLGAKSQEEVRGKSDFDFRPPELAARYLADDQHVMETGETLNIREMAGITDSGELGWLRVNKAPLRDSQGKIIGLVGIAQDVTDRKRAEEALARERDLLRALMDTIPDHIYFKDRASRFLRISLAQAKHFGLNDPAEAIEKTDFDFFTPEHAQPAFDDEQQIIHTGQSIVNKEERETHPDGRVTWCSTTKEPLRDRDGNIIGTVGISRDITARKEADEKLKIYAERLERSNRDLQDFAYVASHDLQEPLRKIQAFGDRLKSKYNDALGETGRDYLARMFDAAGRMQTLINDLLTFSRVTTKAQPFVPVDLDKVLREVLSDLEVRLEQTHGKVEAGQFGTMDADPLQMRQLFQNLIGNALKFHKENESPVIRVQGCLLNSDSPPRIEIKVADNGIGFEQKYADRIFGIFQRLHGRGQYEGTGVGLAICKKIVERHGGVIRAESKPGEGATFTVMLPVKHSNGDDKT